MKKIIQIQLIFIIITVFQSIAFADINMQINLDPGDVVFMITDPINNTAGFDPATGQTISKENFSYGYAEQSDPQTGRVVASSQEFGGIGLSPGTYKIMTYGKKPTIYGAGISIRWNGYSYPQNRLQSYLMGFSDVGKIDIYEFTVPSSPVSAITIQRVATANNLIADINAANKLGYLNTPGSYQSLLAKAENAKAKMDAGQSVPAKNILNAFINEVSAQKGQQINADAATILIEDAQYIINHN